MNDKTPFGIFFTNLRKERKQTIVEAAKELGVSIAYISSVEHGKREIPKSWKEKIISSYNLNEEEKLKLSNAINNTASNKKISLQDLEYAMNNFIDNTAPDEETKARAKERLQIFLNSLKQ